ncbi:MAG: baseplate J/gp47 family protein [bacterium]|nr:baseplate J/gp47 family protein [bacterium]
MIGTTKNYDIFNGISQADRIKAELNDAFLKIDDRSLPDLVQFISNYADQVNFYTRESVESPESMKRWGKFFTRDNLFLLIIISSYDVQSSKNTIQESMDRLLSTSDKDLQVKLTHEIIVQLLNIAETLNYIRKNIQRTPITVDFLFDLNTEIKTHLNNHLKTLFGLKEKVQWEESTERRFEVLQLEWGWKPEQRKVERESDDSPKPEALEGENLPTEQTESLNRLDFAALKNAFHSFYYTAFHTKGTASELLENLQNNLKNNKPYIALFLTFIHLYEFVKEIMNGLPKKHLDHYYRDVLRLKELPPKPDMVSVSFALNSKEQKYLLPEGSIVMGPKNALGEDIQYKTLSPLLLTDSKIQEINILYKSRDERHHQKPYRNFTTNVFSKQFYRQDRNYFALNGQALLGDEKILDRNSQDTLEHGRVGVIISSSLLRLESGTRHISLTIEFDKEGIKELEEVLKIIAEKNEETIEETTYKVFSTAFQISLSTEEKMLSIPNYVCNLNRENNSWEILFELAADDPAIAPLTETREKCPQNTEPFVELLLQPESYIYLYSVVEKLRVRNIHISTKSTGLKDIKLYNQLGPIDHTKPFEMLGSIPVNGNYVVMGHREAFSKPIETLKMDFTWLNNPILTGGFETYFKQYRNKKLHGAVREKPKTSDYKLVPTYLKGGHWKMLNLNQKKIELFPLLREGHSEATQQYSPSFSVELSKEELNAEIVPLKSYKPYSQDSTNGNIKLTFTCPEVEFGHEAYPTLLSETVMYNARLKKKEIPIRTPNTPFAPVIESVQLSYTAYGSAISSGASSNENPNNVHLYQLSPFGYKRVELKSTEHLQPFFNTDTYEGNLMLGLDKIPSNGEITLLFDMNDENTNDKYRQRAPIHWSYMRDGQWVSFGKDGVMGDTTNGFINSGIVRLFIPADINRKTTTLNNELFWIRGSIEDGALNLGKFDGIYENATLVAWDGTSSPIHLDQPLPKLQLTKMKDATPEITAVSQPNSSYAGKREENDQEFYKRISEQLRHKRRAVNALDYEQLVLQKFHFLEKVKCFMSNHTLSEDYRDLPNLIVPGTVHIAVIPKTGEERNFRPQVSPKVLNLVQNYISDIASPFVNVEVTNAYYEEIRVNCQVHFSGYESKNFYLEKLQKKITEYLSSWLAENPSDGEFGKNVYKSDTMAYIQNLDFVDFVTEFSIVKIVRDDEENYDLKDTAREIEFEEEIKVKFPWSILISAKSHNIQVINDPAYASPKARGIDNMELGMDFIITE